MTIPAVHAEHLVRLFRHEATALHVPNFYHRYSAERLGEKLILESQSGNGGGRNWKVSTSRGLESSDVVTLGEHPPYNVAVAHCVDDGDGNNEKKSSSTDDYFEGVLREFRSRRIQRRQRQRNDPINDDDDDDYVNYYRLWPLDKIRLELEEAWPYGAGLARQEETNGRPFGGGLPRIMRGPTRWKRGFVHVDELGPLHPHRGLFSANIYLTMPLLPEQSSSTSTATGTVRRDSGALYIWPLGVRSRWDWYRVRVIRLFRTPIFLSPRRS